MPYALRSALCALRLAPRNPQSGLNPLFPQHFTLNADHHILYRHFPLSCLGGLLRQAQQSHTAGNLHDQHGEGIDLGVIDPGFNLFLINILAGVQFGTADGCLLYL